MTLRSVRRSRSIPTSLRVFEQQEHLRDSVERGDLQWLAATPAQESSALRPWNWDGLANRGVAAKPVADVAGVAQAS